MKTVKNLVIQGITVLLLGNNKITSVGVKYLADALMERNVLRVIWLEDNQIDDAGCEALAKPLARDEDDETECLSLSGNPITPKGISILTEAIKAGDRFRCLMLNRIKIGAEGAKAFSCLESSNVEALSLNDTELGD